MDEDPAAKSRAIQSDMEDVVIRMEDVAAQARRIFERMRAPPRQPQEPGQR